MDILKVIIIVIICCISFASPLRQKVRQPSKPRWKNEDWNQDYIEIVGIAATGTLSLICKAKGYPEPKISWMKEGEPFVHRVTKEPFKLKKGKLIIENSNLQDSGNYSCTAENSEGSITHKFLVKINERMVAMRPQIKNDQPGNHTVLIGANLTLLCQEMFKSPVDGLRIAWIRHLEINGSFYDDDGRLHFQVVQNCSIDGNCIDIQNKAKNSYRNSDYKNAREYHLYNIKESDRGYYSCLAENRHGMTLNSGFVEVFLEDPEELKIRQNKAERTKVIFISTGVVILIFLVCLFALLWMSCRARSEKRKRIRAMENARSVLAWTKRVIIEKNENVSDVLIAPNVIIEKKRSQPRLDELSGTPISCEYEFEKDVKWEIPRSLLSMGSILGEGNFGKVMQATLKSSSTASVIMPSPSWMTKSPSTIVAVKMLKEGHTDADVIDLVKEMTIMKMIGTHENVLKLIGVCTQPAGQQLYVVVEYARYGNLKNYLRARRPSSSTPDSFTTTTTESVAYERPRCGTLSSSCYNNESRQGLSFKEMYNFSYQIAKGMRYLASRKCVHRDLAARNVLLADHGIIKIADFGMARDVNDSEYYRKNSDAKLPIKWLAPEAYFQNYYSTQSDVWSYGIVLWEIVTHAQQPYKDIFDIVTLFHKFKDNYRLPKPENCPDYFYDVMRICWRYNPYQRPDWAYLENHMHSLFTGKIPNNYLVVTLPQHHQQQFASNPYYINTTNRIQSIAATTNTTTMTTTTNTSSIYFNVNNVREFTNYTYGETIPAGSLKLNQHYLQPRTGSVNETRIGENVFEDDEDLPLPPAPPVPTIEPRKESCYNQMTTRETQIAQAHILRKQDIREMIPPSVIRTVSDSSSGIHSLMSSISIDSSEEDLVKEKLLNM